MMKHQGFFAAMAVISGLLLGGCAISETVAPYERGNLAEPAMAWNPDATGASYRDHMHNSKAATPAAATVGGGGCGCN